MCLPPSEFQPGVPWKGIDRVDPESDPYMTPGSMMRNTVSPNLNDTEHQLLQDNSGKQSPHDVRTEVSSSQLNQRRCSEEPPQRDTVEIGRAILDASAFRGKSSFISHRDSVVSGNMTHIQSILSAWIDMKNTLLNHQHRRRTVFAASR